MFYEKALDFISRLNSYVSGNTASLVGEEPRLLRHASQKCLADIFHRTSLHHSWGWTMAGSEGAFREDDPWGGHGQQPTTSCPKGGDPSRGPALPRLPVAQWAVQAQALSLQLGSPVLLTPS